MFRGRVLDGFRIEETDNPLLRIRLIHSSQEMYVNPGVEAYWILGRLSVL